MVTLAIIIVHVFMGYCTCSVKLFKQQKYYFIFYFCILLIIEYNEKLKAKVTEILEEKTQVEDTKHIITG